MRTTTIPVTNSKVPATRPQIRRAQFMPATKKQIRTPSIKNTRNPSLRIRDIITMSNTNWIANSAQTRKVNTITPGMKTTIRALITTTMP